MNKQDLKLDKLKNELKKVEKKRLENQFKLRALESDRSGETSETPKRSNVFGVSKRKVNKLNKRDYFLQNIKEFDLIDL